MSSILCECEVYLKLNLILPHIWKDLMYVFQGQNADWPQISYLIFTLPDLQWVQNFKELRQTKNLC